MRHFFRCRLSGRIGDFGNEPSLNGIFRRRIDTGQVRGRVKLSALQIKSLDKTFQNEKLFPARTARCSSRPRPFKNR